MEKNMVNIAAKNTLAKLLAKEGITVQHGNYETAYFDVENRVLGLPVWKDMDNLYDLLVGHEVGHALGLKHFGSDCGEICESNFDPNDVGINSQDTVMSYNSFVYPVDDLFFTELDIKALIKIWGDEKAN